MAWLLVFSAAGCRLQDSFVEPIPPVGSLDAGVAGADAGPRDASAQRDGAADLDAASDAAGPCAGLPAPLVEWVFDMAMDPATAVPDSAEAEPEVPLRAAVRDPIGVRFLADGVELSGGHLEAAFEDGRALGEAIVAAGSLTVELWASTPHGDNTGPARIFTYSAGAYARALSIMQNRDGLQTRLRTTATGDNGVELGASIPGVFPTAAPRHLVLTYDGGTGLARVYVDGELRDEHLHEEASGMPGALVWDLDQDRLGCGDELTDGIDQGRSWQGTLHSVRVWNAALTAQQVACRFGEP